LGRNAEGVRLHPFKEPVAALETENYAEITPILQKKTLRSDILCPHLPISLPPRNLKY
jgi:hypothetical protein